MNEIKLSKVYQALIHSPKAEQKLLNSKNHKDDIDLLVSLHGLCSIGLGPDDHAPAVEGHGVLPDTASGLALADCLGR